MTTEGDRWSFEYGEVVEIQIYTNEGRIYILSDDLEWIEVTDIWSLKDIKN